MKRGFLKTAKARRTGGVGLPQAASMPSSSVVAPKADNPIAISYQIATTRPTEGLVSAKVVGPETGGDTGNYSETAFVFVTLPPKNFGDTLKDEPHNWTEWMLAEHIKLQILNTPRFPRPVEKTSGGKVNHRIGPSPFGGLGMFTTRSLRTGDLIFAERPLLITQRGCQFTIDSGSKRLTKEEVAQVQMYEWEKYLDIALKRMTDENREAFMALANSHTEDESGPILGIVRTNGYVVPGLYDSHRGDATGAYTAILNGLSRINHSCSPNTRHRFDMASLSFELRAVRDIKRGEELFYSYCTTHGTKNERAEELAPYDIVCACSACVRATKETDLLRTELVKRVQKIQADHNAWMKDESLPNVLASSLKLIAEIEKEGLTSAPSFILLLGMVGVVYATQGNENSAMKYMGQLNNAFKAAQGSSGVLIG